MKARPCFFYPIFAGRVAVLPYGPVRCPNLSRATVGRMDEGSRGEVTLGGVTERLLGSEEPAVRYKVLTKVLGREPASVAVPREEIRVSPRVKRLLSERDEDGKIPFHPYAKWYGAHWDD